MKPLLVTHVQKGNRVRVKLHADAPAEWREVRDAFQVNFGKTESYLVIAAPEAPRGELAVAFPPEAMVYVEEAP